MILFKNNNITNKETNLEFPDTCSEMLKKKPTDDLIQEVRNLKKKHPKTKKQTHPIILVRYRHCF